MANEIDAILKERGEKYGKFKDHAKLSQTLKFVILDHYEFRHTALMDDDMIEAIEMICHKLARIANGDPWYADSWDDIAGYSKLVGDRLRATDKTDR